MKRKTVPVEILMAPSKNILGQDRWWRNSHNDREVWYRRIREGVEARGLVPGTPYALKEILIDWGRRKPSLRQDGMDRIKAVVGSGLIQAGVMLAGTMGEVELRQSWSGRGYGQTTLILEVRQEQDDARGKQPRQHPDAPVHQGEREEELSAEAPDGSGAVSPDV